MKTIILIFLLFLFCLSQADANKLILYEYWYDNNYNSKTVVDIDDEYLLLDTEFNMPEGGANIFNIRFKDENNLWSEVYTHYFSLDRVSSNNKIMLYEYWFDDAAPTQVNLQPNLSHFIDVEKTIPSFDTGIFSVRFQDMYGFWSSTRTYYILSSKVARNNEMIEYEYWFDDGDRISQTIEPEKDFILDVEKLIHQQGASFFNIRFKDKSDYYSPVSTYYLKVAKASPHNKIIAYQYWFDDGEINDVAISPSQSFMIDMDKIVPETGANTFNIRFLDILGKWSPVQTNFIIRPGSLLENEIVYYEYWYNDDRENLYQVQLENPVSMLKVNDLLNIPEEYLDETVTYSVRFKDEMGQWSAVYTKEVEYPEFLPPYLIKPDLAELNIDLNPTFQWSNMQNATAYEIQISEVSDFSELIEEYESTANNYTTVDLNLDYETKYYWRVKAIYDEEESDWSEAFVFTTMPEIPPPPVLKSPASLSQDMMTYFDLQWYENIYAENFDVNVSEYSNFSTLFANYTTKREYVQIADLEPGNTYYWRVRASNRYGTKSIWSDVWEFTVSETADDNIQYVRLSTGWNFISTYIEKDDMGLPILFEPINENIVIVKMGSGIYIPANNLNTLGNWNITKAYNVFASAPRTLVFDGTIVEPENTDIVLATGWNAVPYLRKESMPITTALADIQSKIVIVKNRFGQIWIPGSINTIQTMYPGEGYSIFMTQTATLNYPAN